MLALCSLPFFRVLSFRSAGYPFPPWLSILSMGWSFDPSPQDSFCQPCRTGNFFLRPPFSRPQLFPRPDSSRRVKNGIRFPSSDQLEAVLPLGFSCFAGLKPEHSSRLSPPFFYAPRRLFFLEIPRARFWVRETSPESSVVRARLISFKL